MATREEEFLKRLQETFRIEADEHINALSSGLIELEKKPDGKRYAELIEIIFREAHSLKGAARSVDRDDVESVCQVLESIFSKVKYENFSLSADHYDLIHKAIDSVTQMLADDNPTSASEEKDLVERLKAVINEEQNSQSKKESVEIESIAPDDSMQIEQLSETEVIEELPIEEKPKIIPEPAKVQKSKENPKSKPSEEKSQQLETIRIQTSKLDSLFLQSEQMIQTKITYDQRAADLKGIYNFVESWKTEFSKIENKQSADGELQLKEMVSWTKNKLDEAERNIFTISRALENDQRALGRMIDDQIDSIKNVVMIPISTITEVFPRLVRDLARGQGKEVELTIKGNEIEVDKRILEELKDPLIHLLRNCIDHGLKKPEERQKINKPAQGTLKLTFSVVDGRNLDIQITDDGSGINTDKVVSAALKAGIISAEDVDKLTEKEKLALVFSSGITTSPIITDLSGRGLGLAIVREKVEKLGGKVRVESELNVGVTFHLLLPLTLATFRGVLVKTGEYFFFLPTVHVERVLRVRKDSIKTLENRDTILIDKEVVGTVKLSDAMGLRFGIKSKSNQIDGASGSDENLQLLVLNSGSRRICFQVDEILDEHQILVKELGKHLKRVRNISGAAVLGSGRVVPVLNVQDLMKSAMDAASSSKSINGAEQEIERVFKVLVVDDSITSRTLIKNIIETAGYDVTTAVDGVDAFTKASVGEFDLLVSDVDMPRMNGFELTTKVRKDKKLGELPVILVTALESREDKEHGIDVGANAYIVKSSFDQSNLLEVIQKIL